MKRALFILMLLIVSASMLSADNSDKEKIQQLEQRIRELELRLQSGGSAGDSSDLQEVKNQLAVLADEIEKLRSGEETIEVTEQQQRTLGLGPSAASIYTKPRGVSIAGYGEMLYENFAEDTEAGVPSNRFDQLDFLRAIVYFGYRFNDRVLFNSEIEFEHAATDKGGSVSVEFAHIDYVLNDALTLRGGLVLLPMGFVNEWHEPNVFLGAKRPVTESVIIPTTWRENGAGILGRSGMFQYRAYLVNGFDATNFRATGLRDARQKGASAKIRKPSLVARIDATPVQGLLVGGSVFTGDSVYFASAAADLEVGTFIGELHAEYRRGPLEIRGLFAKASLDDVAPLNAILGLTGNASVGESLSGSYIQAGYNVLAGRDTDFALTPYLRYEKVNTQDDVPSGFLANPANDRSITTVGLEFRPIHDIVVKADYQKTSTEADSGLDQWNLLLGYSF